MIAVWLLFLLLAPVVAQAGTATINLSVNIQPVGTSTLLPTPPSGFHWVQTFADEFNTTFPDTGRSGTPVTLNNSVWNVYHYVSNADYSTYNPPTYGSNSLSDASDTVSNGILSMSSSVGQNILATSPGGYATNSFSQQYGYFVYDSKLPTCAGPEFDLESFGVVTNNPGGAYGELAWDVEQNKCNYSNVEAYEIDQNHSFWSITNVDVGVDVTLAFHQYGMLWVNDGSAHGSVTIYFDGNVIGGPYQLKSPSFDSGLFFDIYGSNTPDMEFDWVRAYQLAPG